MDFIIKVNPRTIILKADPDTIQDLVTILQKLLDVAMTMKRKTAIVESRRRRSEAKQQTQQQKKAEKMHIEIFNRYQMHLRNGCMGDKRKAHQAIMEEYHLTATDAKIIVQIGRGLSKALQYQLAL
jgi:hypothetical protein